MANSELPTLSSLALPRILIVSRRAVRKNKFVDFVGEYHLDLILRYGAVPVIIPRVSKIYSLLQSFEPFHGVLLCEGEDIDSSLYETKPSGLSPEELDEIKKLHPSDTSIDKEKDSIELKLANLCLEKNIPILGICRGCQILNVSCGGTLYQDIEKEIFNNGCFSSEFQRVSHINYENYDEHRHVVKVVEKCPLHVWFNDSMKDGRMEIMVNSYHHQGVKRLAQRFVPMAFSVDGLVEGFYDPNGYNPEEGKFIVGLQFHPERMRYPDGNDFDYPGCPMVYQEFVKAVIAHEKKLNCSILMPRAPKLSEELEVKRRIILKSLSVSRNAYKSGFEVFNQEREKVATNMMENMSIEQLYESMVFYQLMGQICSETIERKLHELASVHE